MVEQTRAAILIDSKAADFSGDKPGIRDELERFSARHPTAPADLIGGAGGETVRLIADAEFASADWEHNGLRDEARRLLHQADEPALVAALIARALTRDVTGSVRR